MTTRQFPAAAGVTVARLVRPHGRRGEVAAEILTDFPERLTRLKHAYLHDAKKDAASSSTADLGRRVGLRSCWLSHSRGGQAIFHFEGSESISDAEKLVGLEVRIPLAERAPLPGGSYYVTDLIGCEVREKGATVGVVRDVEFTGGTPLLAVDSPRGEVLIPLAQEICVNVDLAGRRIDVVLPQGLLELNR
ncbi:MAG TPA: ribosome maturation factor RimM [Candidatus Acidoferrales bacterium]|nr:ribosome maturation factor RimM [Candidatus Acidoferrales bacterium]